MPQTSTIDDRFRLSNIQIFPQRVSVDKIKLNTGTGSAIGHHGEVLQGAIEREGENIRRFLVTLPWPSIKSHSKFIPVYNGELVIEQEWKSKSKRAAALTMLYLGIEGYGGFLEVVSDASAEMGLGSSTSDVVATIRAVAAAFHQSLTAIEISEISVMAEIASDSIMFEDQAVVFCQREGIILESLVQKLPPAFIIGFNTYPNGSGVSTIQMPLPEYGWQELGAFRPMIGSLRAAVRTQSISLMGKVATASAKLNQKHLPKPNFDGLLHLLSENGACGLQVAHSGSVAGFIFDPSDSNLAQWINITKKGLTNLGIESMWYFNTAWESQ
ncbi:GHMP family kinase ATP-binding protein [Sulfuriferula nivalis]|uniref:Kinase n=1 Tax=Sulfuriferula nivalis TaxID=2675298 RepID=A0A809RLT0_9PROT|nr:kinase [Sulfuriferula nivalis]BBP02516.1 kinase [Sulfuriferula nivalis]